MAMRIKRDHPGLMERRSMKGRAVILGTDEGKSFLLPAINNMAGSTVNMDKRQRSTPVPPMSPNSANPIKSAPRTE